MSFPFFGKEFEFVQPDGNKIRVMGWGDQYYAVFRTPEGFTVMKDPDTGFWHYADTTDDKMDLKPVGPRLENADPGALGLSAGVRISRDAAKTKALIAYTLRGEPRRCEVRRERYRSLVRSALKAGVPLAAPPKRETVGKYVGLCVPVQFPDVPGTIKRQEISDFCNKKGYSGYANKGSVCDVFSENSIGKLEYTNVVTEYYRAKKKKEYYTDPTIPQPQRAVELIKEALDHLMAQGFDFSPLTADDGAYVYALNVFYAGSIDNNWAEGLWPHSWHLDSPYQLMPGKLAYDYQFTNIGSELSLGIFCHENGHMICDYPDLYDYGYESNGVGSYCLMCAGGNVDEKNPHQIGAYLKYKSGWARSVTEISGPISATIGSETNDFFLRRKSATEYYIIENRIRKGRDATLPSEGLAIWHVDELGSNNNEQGTPSSHYECALIQADNRLDLEKRVNQGDSTDLFSSKTKDIFGDQTAPNSKWWDKTKSGLEIYEISKADSVMAFKAK